MIALLAFLRKVPLWLWLALAASGAIAWLNWRLDYVKSQRDDQASQVATLANRNASLVETARLQRQLANDYAQASQGYQEGLKDAESDIARLRADLDRQPDRLQVHGSCVPRTPANSAAPASGSNGATCQLTADARSGYLDLRQGLAAKDAQIIALQSLAKSLQAACFVKQLMQ